MIYSLPELICKLKILKEAPGFLEGAAKLDLALSVSNVYDIEGVESSVLDQLGLAVMDVEECVEVLTGGAPIIDPRVKEKLRREGYTVQTVKSGFELYLDEKVYIRIEH